MRLNAKILATMAVVLVAASLAFLALFVPQYRNELLGERREVSQRLGNALQITLENAMLKRDLDGLREIVSRLGTMPNVARVLILAPSGEVRFASKPELVTGLMEVDQLCEGCGVGAGKALSSTTFVTDADGHEVLRSVNAVANREPCQACHGPMADHPVNGYLVIDYRADTIQSQARSLASAQGMAGIAVILGALGAAWLAIRRFVVQPVHLYASVADQLAAGDFSARHRLDEATTGRSDEVAGLGRAVNSMAARLDDTMTRLKERELFQQGVIDGVPDGIRVIADDGRVIAANRAFCEQAGLPLDVVLANRCFYSSHDRSDFCVPTLVVCPLKALAESNMPVKCSHHHVHHGDNTVFAAEVVAAPVQIGARRYVVEAIRNLSQNVDVSQQQRLSEIGQLAAGVAHEIHNPLSSIRLGIRALKSALPPPTAGESDLSEYLSVVDTEIDRCIAVTERLIRLSRISSEQGMLINVAPVANDLAVLLRYEAEMSRSSLTIDVPPELRVIADQGELGMVLLNLVQNAFHAMPTGGAIAIRAEATDAGRIDIHVSDSGHGIETDDLARIFHPFWSRRSDGTTGSGLGLSICKALVEKRDGTIDVASTPGQGTTFTLSYPNPDLEPPSGAEEA